jgi:hypothetical protein
MATLLAKESVYGRYRLCRQLGSQTPISRLQLAHTSMVLFMWGLFVAHLFLPFRWVRESIAASVARGVSDPRALGRDALKSTVFKSFIGYGCIAVIAVFGANDRNQSAGNIAQLVFTWIVGFPFMWLACRASIRKNLRGISPMSLVSAIENAATDLKASGSESQKKVDNDVQHLDRRMPWYINATLIVGVLVLYFIASGDALKTFHLIPTTGPGMTVAVLWYATVGAAVESIVALIMLPFWLVVRHQVRPAKVSFGLFLLFGTILFVGSDLFEERVNNPNNASAAYSGH